MAYCTYYFFLITADKSFAISTNVYVKETGSPKHFGLILDTQLYFKEHRKTVFTKVIGTIRLIRNFGTLY